MVALKPIPLSQPSAPGTAPASRERERYTLAELAGCQPALRLRVFIAMPPDVSEERCLMHRVLERLNGEPALAGHLYLEWVDWQSPQEPNRTLGPDDAITQGLLLPSECEIFILVMWSQAGMQLPPAYQSTVGPTLASVHDWQYRDALTSMMDSGTPALLIFHRQESCHIALDNPDFATLGDEWQRLQQLCRQLLQPDCGHDPPYRYHFPSQFEQQLEHQLRQLLIRRWSEWANRPSAHRSLPEPPRWQGSPYPGLRPFQERDAPIFFGREREVDDIIARLRKPGGRFLAVVGTSGAGKTSLIAAGLLPRLRAGVLANSRHWLTVRFTPGERGSDPFHALANAMQPVLKRPGLNPTSLAEVLRGRSAPLQDIVENLLSSHDDDVEMLLFVDQFEEVFTLVDRIHCATFLDLLARLADWVRIRIVITLRVDFYNRFLEWPSFARLLQHGSYPLPTCDEVALRTIISEPAARAGLRLETDLTEQLVQDCGSEPGSLALLAFALSELHELRQDGVLSWDAYRAIQGLRGAIPRRAEEAHRSLDEVGRDALGSLFRSLVAVSDRGSASRRRVPFRQVSTTGGAAEAIAVFTRAKLLTRSQGRDDQPVLEVAHESLLRAWPALAEWIERTHEDLLLLRQLKGAAAEWTQDGRAGSAMWLHERMSQVNRMLERLKPELNASERRFLNPEVDYLIQELEDPLTPHPRRNAIGERLAELGDVRPGVRLDNDGLPAPRWCAVMYGQVTLPGNSRSVTVHPFQIAKYPVSWCQYRVFVEAEDGYGNTAWWQGLADRQERPGKQYQRQDNHPAEQVSWYDAIAFCRWLSVHLGYTVTLPTEWEWQQAAGAGVGGLHYPWGNNPDPSRANAEENRLGRTVAVGLYPQGAAPCGALDMSGNVWEWCLNGNEEPQAVDLSGDGRRVVRGGSWVSSHEMGSGFSRVFYYPDFRDRHVGFRLCRHPAG